MKKVIVILVLLLAVMSMHAEIEEALPFHFDYNLSRFRILTVAADEFNYEETVELSGIWQAMGARVDYAGPRMKLSGEKSELAPPDAPAADLPELTVDFLLTGIDAGRYDLIYFAGGEGIGRLVKEHGATLRGLIEKAHQGKARVAALCHAPLVLSVSDRVKGARVTANGDGESQALRRAGATVVDEVFVSDGKFLTGQWPFVRTFAFQVAEKLQFPAGNGPFQKFLAARTVLEKAFDDLRSTREVTGQEIADDVLDKVFRSAFKTILLQPWGNYPPLFKLVRVRDGQTKEAIAREIAAALKRDFLAAFGSEERIDMHVRRCFVTPPVLCFAFIDTEAVSRPDPQGQEMAFRAAVTRYGAALENIALTARSLGLGIGLLGYPPLMKSAEKAVRDALEIGDAMAFVDMFALGHPVTSNPPAVSRPLSVMMADGRMVRPAPGQ